MLDSIKLVLGKNWKLIILSVAIFSLNLVLGAYSFWLRLLNWVLGISLVGYIAFMSNENIDETIFTTADVIMGRKNYGSK